MSAALGTERTVELPQGTIAYRDLGTGRPVVFVHGALVNADLWRKVVPQVAAAGHRCLSPDLPLGAHRHPMPPDADLTPPALAALIAGFLEALDLTGVTLVGNDTGGALVQILMARHKDLDQRIDRVVLASCDALECFFPKPFNLLTPLAKVPGVAWPLVQAFRLRGLQRTPLGFGWVARRPLPPEAVESYLTPARRSAGVRRDLRKVVRDVHRRHTLAAAATFAGFDRPVLLAWAAEDRLFPVPLARRLAGMLPDARLVLIADSYTFIPEDRPDELARHILEFTGAVPETSR